MEGKVLNITVCNPIKLRRGLTVNYYEICHYSYNLPVRFVIFCIVTRLLLDFLCVK